MDPNVAFPSCSPIGTLALYAEFNRPGAVTPGTVGVVFILLAAFALNLLPVRFAAIAMIIGAFALFAAEAKFASHGVLTAEDVLLTIGSLSLVNAPISRNAQSRFVTASPSRHVFFFSPAMFFLFFSGPGSITYC